MPLILGSSPPHSRRHGRRSEWGRFASLLHRITRWVTRRTDFAHAHEAGRNAAWHPTIMGMPAIRSWLALMGLMGAMACSGGGVSGPGSPPGDFGVDAADPAPDALGEATELPDAAGEVAPGPDSRRCSAERCNGLDDDCDGVTDPPGSYGCQPFYPDRDGDGWGALEASRCLCASEAPYAAVATGDCDDADLARHPAALEACNGLDDNCNGQVDEWTYDTCYRDRDRDGWGSLETLASCDCPDGWVPVAGDCNDANSAFHPVAPEVCDGLDQDCDGVADDGLPTITVFLDGDGDGFAAATAPSVEACSVPFGFALPRDANGDGALDWDCDDSDIAVFPGAVETCNGRDDDCDGVTDRLCFTPCPGEWPFRLRFAQGNFEARPADLDGDGYFEVIVQDHLGFAILDDRGRALYEHSAPEPNYSRAAAVLADLDDFDQFGPGTQTLEVLTGNGGLPRFYRLEDDRTVTVFEGTTSVFDASRFMAADLGRDGVVEFFTGTWCAAGAAVQVFRFDRSTGQIGLVQSIADPDGKCEYGDGRALTDLDGDGVLELLLGNGFDKPSDPKQWGGRIHAFRFTDLDSLQTEPLCDLTECFSTALPDLYPARVSDLLRFEDRLGIAVVHFEAAVPGVENPSRWFWHEFSLDGTPLGQTEFQVPPGIGYPTDVDDDGVVEFHHAVPTVGLWDLDGDGIPEEVGADGTDLFVGRWDPTARTFIEWTPSRTSVSVVPVEVRAVWDLGADGRADVLAADADGRVFCRSLGAKSWNPRTSLPPHLPWYLRTYQWDNLEPNDGKDVDGDGLPDRVAYVPSALTRKGAFYSYLSSEHDQDAFLVNTGWNGAICLTAPPGRDYALDVFSFADKWNNESHAPVADGKPDGLVWTDTTGAGGAVCFHGTFVTPYRTGEYRFIARVRSVAGASPHRPYWLSAPK